MILKEIPQPKMEGETFSTKKKKAFST